MQLRHALLADRVHAGEDLCAEATVSSVTCWISSSAASGLRIGLADDHMQADTERKFFVRARRLQLSPG